MQPIYHLFRSHHCGPTCMIYVVIVKPGLAHQYDSILDYSFFQHNFLLNAWNLIPRHRLSSYFDSTMIVLFASVLSFPSLKLKLNINEFMPVLGTGSNPIFSLSQILIPFGYVVWPNGGKKSEGGLSCCTHSTPTTPT